MGLRGRPWKMGSKRLKFMAKKVYSLVITDQTMPHIRNKI